MGDQEWDAQFRDPAGSGTHQAVVDGGFAHDFRSVLAARRSSLRGLSLQLAERGVQVSTPVLAAWRAGTAAPAGVDEFAAVRRLEELLSVPSGHLTRWVDPAATPQRPGERRPGASTGAAVDLGASPPGTGPLAPAVATDRVGSSRDARTVAAVQRARTALGLERTGQLCERSVDLVLELDEHGVERRVTQRTEWVAQVDGVDTFPAVLITASPGRKRARVEPVSGCRLGPTYSDLSEGVFAAALVLPLPLRAGESVTTVHRTHLPEDVAPDSVYEHRLLHRVERISVGAVFDADHAPSAWQGFSRDDDDERAGEVVPQGGVARVSRDDFGPGAVGLSWSW